MTKIVDISSLNLNAVADAEIPYKMQVKRADGSLTPLILHVLGQNSDVVEKLNNKFSFKERRDEIIARKKGVELEPLDPEIEKNQSVERVLVRVVGWEGVSNEFTKEAIKNIIFQNPYLAMDILSASLDAANFTKTA